MKHTTLLLLAGLLGVSACSAENPHREVREDPAAGTVLRTIPVGKRPWGLALSPDGALLYVGNGPSDDVSVVDVAAGKEVGRVKGGAGPWGVAVVPAPR